MLFSSPVFILLFLPIVFFGYFFLNRVRLVWAGRLWLIASSLFFYAYWKIAYLPLLLGSILVNYFIGYAVSPHAASSHPLLPRRKVLVVGIIANLALLGYFKYSNFLMDNINMALKTGFDVPSVILPLGISFYTFIQIAFLVDSYRGEVKDYSILSYVQFVSFFPYLIAGPIVRHHEMAPQFQSRWIRAVRYRNVMQGLFIFSIGLFKKLVLTDTFSIWANAGFDGGATSLDFLSAWAASLSYTFQLYFDFSGYCDMGIGAALLFNIKLPINFNSPYKALSIQEFWRRWHMTLSRYLRDYLYIPLGGNRCSNTRLYFNLIVTFLLAGLWHGASWMFVIWGAMHGTALVVHRIWRKSGFHMPKVLAWMLTFNFINIAWIFFRAGTMRDAMRVLGGMVDVGSLFHCNVADIPTKAFAWGGWFSDDLLSALPTGLAANILCYGLMAIAFVVIKQKNSIELMKSGDYGACKVLGALLLFCVALYSTILTKSPVFLYFNF